MWRLIHSFTICSRATIHTSKSNPAIPPVFAFLIKPLSRVGAALIGRKAKKIWKALPDHKKEYFKSIMLKNNTKIGVIAGVLVGGGLVAYESHVEINPITNKRRFVMLNPDQMRKVAENEFNQLLQANQENILKISHPSYKRVSRLVQTIFERNKEVKELSQANWTITVVNNDDEVNAFVLPVRIKLWLDT